MHKPLLPEEVFIFVSKIKFWLGRIDKIVEEKGVAEAAREVEVVTTGTFGPMCIIKDDQMAAWGDINIVPV